jgi:hypothetical protein
MIDSKKSIYKAFGLSVQSDILLPELVVTNAKPNIFIGFGDVPDQFENPAFSAPNFQVSPDKFLLKIEGVAKYLVEYGNKITIDRGEGGSDDEIRLYLLGSAFGALIHQRGLLPMHGSSIIFDNKAIIFSGRSGAGKSTLAAGFVKRGFKLLADDVSVVTPYETGELIVHPGYPQMKLWNDSLEKLGHQPKPLRRIRSGLKKYALPMGVEFYSEPAPLVGIYIITVSDKESISLKTLKGIEKFNTLKNNTYRLSFLKGAGTGENHFKLIELVSQHCFVKVVERPSKSFHLDKLIEVIKDDLSLNHLLTG